MFGRSLQTLSRWRHASSSFVASSRLRREVKPPSLRQEPDSAWERLRFWLFAPSPMDAAPPLSRLPKARSAFLKTLDDTESNEARALALRIERARSLRELWHLRASLYGLLAREKSQAEAERRLNRLKPHFETRGASGDVFGTR